MPDVRCAQLARALDEPLAGTAAHAPRWLCLEHPRPWARDTSADLNPAVAELSRRATAAGWLVTFIRRPGRGDAPRRRRVLLADTTPPGSRVHAVEVSDPAELLDLNLAGLARLARLPGLPGVPLTDPALLICTHGRRDACCALAGRALVAAVEAAEPGVWECSHLGGHRFAPTAVVLPTGYVYGRLDVASATAARKAAGMGELELTNCRGRSTWSAPGQVAELAVRGHTGLRDAATLLVEPAIGDPDTGTTVTVRQAGGREWRVRVRRHALRGGRPTSCGAEPEPLTPLVAESIQEIADHRRPVVGSAGAWRK